MKQVDWMAAYDVDLLFRNNGGSEARWTGVVVQDRRGRRTLFEFKLHGHRLLGTARHVKHLVQGTTTTAVNELCSISSSSS